jgi:FAD binding domain/Berberine and berberine like
MGLIARRWFVQQTAFTAAALYGRPIKVFVGRAGLFGTNEQSTTHIDPVAIRELASEITGHVITPDASDYESSRLVNNLAYDRHPALIVRCAGASDVARALDFAQRHSLPLAVRSGGHSAGGYGVCDGGVVIDLSGMTRVEVDAGTRVARADAGCLVGHLDEAMQRFGLATPVGTCSTVGIAGLTLGGGEGALMPKYGATCDNLISAHMVTVDGRQIEASQNSNPDLFWAIRGGGGNFGVVTAFEYRLHPVSEVLAGTLSYPAGRIPELLHACAKFTEAAPDELSVTGRILPSDDGPTFQMLVEYCGQVSVGNDLLRPLRAQLKPRADGVVATSHLEAQRKWFPAAKPSGFFVANVFLPRLGEAAIAAIAAAIQDAPRRFMILLPNFRGAVTRVSSTEMAFAMRQPGYEVDLFGDWAAQEAEEKEGAVRWVKALRDKLQPMSQGVYVNGMSETSDQLVRAAYGPNYARLVEIKKKYDPTNVLRLNQNIRPA